MHLLAVHGGRFSVNRKSLWLQAACQKFTQESQGQLTIGSKGRRLRRRP